MKIAILGAGRVGSSLARNLSNNNYEVSIVDESKTKIDLLQEKLDVGCVVGHAAHKDSLLKLGVDEDTIVIAVTSNDEVNIIACQIAKKQFNAKKTICRFRDSAYINDLEIFGEGVIDMPISPEYEVTSHLRELIVHPGANQIEEFADGKVKLVSVKAKKQGKLVGRELKNIKEDMPESLKRKLVRLRRLLREMQLPLSIQGSWQAFLHLSKNLLEIGKSCFSRMKDLKKSFCRLVKEMSSMEVLLVGANLSPCWQTPFVIALILIIGVFFSGVLLTNLLS